MSEDPSNSAGMNLLDAVDASVEAGEFRDEDQAVIALARRYAIELDAAASIEAEFAELVNDPELRGTAYQRLSKLETRVRASQTVEGVGPKLLAALDALGLSPLARSKTSKGGAQDPAASATANALALLRGDELAKRRPA